MAETNKIRTRFAPSPTGFLHIGSLRTALFAYLFAKRNSGLFILRVEDTDQARFIEGAIEKIIHILEYFGLRYDEGVAVENGKIADKGKHGPYLQSRRKDIYREHADKLIASGHAYYCFCGEKRLAEVRKEQEALKKPTHYDRTCRNLPAQEIQKKLDAGIPHVIRQAIPLEGRVVYNDLVFGEISIENRNLDDQILMKSDGFPTYHLAVVVDDHFMEISHVIRGDEWIPSTPKHILLYRALGWSAPIFAHLPLILNKDKSKLSKRQGDVGVEDYLEKGYLKEALINFVALLGWNPKSEREIFSLHELVREFDFSKVNKSGAVFDIAKLDWINGIYIRKEPVPKLVEKLLPYLITAKFVYYENGAILKSKMGRQISTKFLEIVAETEKSRLKKLSEIGERVEYYFTHPDYEPEMLIWKKSNLSETRKNLKKLLEFLQVMPEADFTSKQQIETKIKEFISANNLDNGSVLWPLRVSLSGLEASPSPFEILYALYAGYGKYDILSRIEHAIKILE